LPLQTGICTFQATYNGVSCSQNFTISNITSAATVQLKVFLEGTFSVAKLNIAKY